MTSHTTLHNTLTLSGAALDWAVAICCELPVKLDPMGFRTGSEAGYWVWDDAKNIMSRIGYTYSPSTLPNQSAEIIMQHPVNMMAPTDSNPLWSATTTDGQYTAQGETFLIAAMRCFVAGYIGESINVPNLLLQ